MIFKQWFCQCVPYFWWLLNALSDSFLCFPIWTSVAEPIFHGDYLFYVQQLLWKIEWRRGILTDLLQKCGYLHLVETVAVINYTIFCSSVHQYLWAKRHFLLEHLQNGWSCHVSSLRMTRWSCFSKHLILLLPLYTMADLSAASIFAYEHPQLFFCLIQLALSSILH